MKKINKSVFIDILYDRTKLSKDECLIVNDILENNFIFRNKNKIKIIHQFINRLNINEFEAEEIYNISMELIVSSIKEKLRHPFKSKN